MGWPDLKIPSTCHEEPGSAPIAGTLDYIQVHDDYNTRAKMVIFNGEWIDGMTVDRWRSLEQSLETTYLTILRDGKPLELQFPRKKGPPFHWHRQQVTSYRCAVDGTDQTTQVDFASVPGTDIIAVRSDFGVWSPIHKRSYERLGIAPSKDGGLNPTILTRGAVGVFVGAGLSLLSLPQLEVGIGMETTNVQINVSGYFGAFGLIGSVISTGGKLEAGFAVADDCLIGPYGQYAAVYAVDGPLVAHTIDGDLHPGMTHLVGGGFEILRRFIEADIATQVGYLWAVDGWGADQWYVALMLRWGSRNTHPSSRNAVRAEMGEE